MIILVYRKIFYALSGIMVGASFLAILVYGLHFGIDFTGGALTQVTYEVRPQKEVLDQGLGKLPIGEYSLRPAGDDGYILRTRSLNESEFTAVRTVLTESGATPFKTESFSSIGPSIGEELRTKSLIAIVLVMLAIVLFIAFVFRHVAEPVQSWKYGVVAIVTLLHDVIVPLGVFAVLGHYGIAEIDTLFVTALLVILGFSVHDTIVVFDRIRENLRINKQGHHQLSFNEIVGKSLNQTYARSINTSLTTLLTLAALYVFGSTTTEYFALAMLIGIAVGTYSSICIASPLLVTWYTLSKKKT